MDAEEITAQVLSKEKDLQDRFDRMDEDFDRWKLESITSTRLVRTKSGVYTKSSLRANDIDVVSNSLRTFADEVHSKLASAEMQIAVRMAENEGEDKREEIGKLERLLQYALEKGDERLIAMLLPVLRDFTIWSASIRGWVAGRFLVYKDKGNVVFDLMPWDPRWVTYEVGKNGLLWIANKTFRSKADLEAEYDYGKEKSDSIKPSTTQKKTPANLPVVDYFKYDNGKISNAVVCNNVFLKKLTTLNVTSMPCLIMPVATRPPVRGADEDELEGYGDSIFAPIRGMNETRNKFASIIATHANLLAKQPTINYKTPNGIELKSTAYLAEAVLNLPMADNILKEAPMRDIAPTVIQFFNWAEGEVEKGSLPNVRVGSPPQSGTLENLVQEARNIVFNPQLRLLKAYYAGICRLIEEQLISNKIKVDVKTIQKNQYFETQVTPIDLKRPHIIKVEFTARTPWTQLDTYQVADMAKRLGIPDAFIWENILKLADPKGLGDQSAIEMAEHSPKLAMVRAIEALMKAGRDDEAEQLMRDLYQMELQEQMAGGIPGEEIPGEEIPGEVPPEEAIL